MHITLHNAVVSHYSRDFCEHESSNLWVLHQCCGLLTCFHNPCLQNMSPYYADTLRETPDSIVFMMC